MTTIADVRPLGVLALEDGTYCVSSSDPAHAPYHITPDGATLRCGCPSYTYSKDDPARCKHTDAVRRYRDEQFAAELRTTERWCISCGVSPVTSGMLRCPDCAARESVPTASRQVEAIPAEERDVVFDYAAERARLELVNARVAALFGAE